MLEQEEQRALEALGLYDTLDEVLSHVAKDITGVITGPDLPLDVQTTGDSEESPTQRLSLAAAIADQLLEKVDTQTYLGEPKYTYHNKAHTMEQVVPVALELFKKQNELYHAEGKNLLTAKDKELLHLAALFHDTGFLAKYVNNEWVGAHIARQVMQRMGHYSEEHISRVENIIMATKVHRHEGKLTQSAGADDVLAQILCDADMAHRAADLATVQQRLDDLIDEKRNCNQNFDRDTMYQDQPATMQQHTYRSPAGDAMLTEPKNTNSKRFA